MDNEFYILEIIDSVLPKKIIVIKTLKLHLKVVNYYKIKAYVFKKLKNWKLRLITMIGYNINHKRIL